MLETKCPSCGGTEHHTDDCIELYNDNPVCPYCGRKENAPWDVMAIEDGAAAAFECLGCERTYQVMVSVVVRYTTKKAEEDTRRFPRRGANAGTGGKVRMPIPGEPIPVNVQVGSPVPPAQSKGKR